MIRTWSSSSRTASRPTISHMVGQKEEEQGCVSVRSRFAGDEGQKSLEDFIAAIHEEIRLRQIRQTEVQPETK